MIYRRGKRGFYKRASHPHLARKRQHGRDQRGRQRIHAVLDSGGKRCAGTPVRTPAFRSAEGWDWSK
jgi:hypothetical protein